MQGTVATGPRAGAPLLRRLGRPPRHRRAGPLCAAAGGFPLHAATHVPAADRHRLELLCPYVLRPPLSAARLRFLDPHAPVSSRSAKSRLFFAARLLTVRLRGLPSVTAQLAAASLSAREEH